MPREQFITQVLFHMLSSTAPHWYAKEFEDPAEVNTKLVKTAEDLYEKYKASLGEPSNVVAAPFGAVPARPPFAPK